MFVLPIHPSARLAWYTPQELYCLQMARIGRHWQKKRNAHLSHGKEFSELWGITKMRTGLGNGMENGTERCVKHIFIYWFLILRFLFKPKYTLSVCFTFVGKVQQCLVTGYKWNIFVTDVELKSTCTHFDVILCSLCVNLQCWTFPALCKH